MHDEVDVDAVLARWRKRDKLERIKLIAWNILFVFVLLAWITIIDPTIWNFLDR